MDPWVLMFAAWRHRNASHTKSGPGRRDVQGKPHKRLARATGAGTYASHDAAVTRALLRRATRPAA